MQLVAFKDDTGVMWIHKIQEVQSIQQAVEVINNMSEGEWPDGAEAGVVDLENGIAYWLDEGRIPEDYPDLLEEYKKI